MRYDACMEGMIGIFPGTFDPVHNGHITYCTEALRLGLEGVILLPEREPRGKPGVSDFGHRLAMLRLATAAHPRLEVVALSHPQFTVVRTLPELRRRYGDKLALLVGSDVATTLASWPKIDTLLRDVMLIIALRRDDTRAQIEAGLRRVSATARFVCIASPELSTNSSTIRRQGDVTALHPAVQTYVAKHALYCGHT